jgi:hypothetical protein
MSDYADDDYDDYDWFYVEDEYMPADDLAEHAVASPPPTTYGDDDMQEDWDRFDYFNDLEYASDGYDDATFQPHNAKDSKIGQKRKRITKSSRSKKKQKTTESAESTNSAVTTHSPVVWRSQSDRVPKQKLVTNTTQSFALFKDWREKLADTPSWARGSPSAKSPSVTPGEPRQALASLTSELLQEEEEVPAEDEEMDEDGDMGISQDALMAALQKQLATAGGPLSGMDPQQLLQFAMRMATDKDAGDDIAGEVADAMLAGEEEDDAATEENLLSWVAQQRNANKDAAATEPKSPEAARDSKQPPTPPSSEPNRSIKAAENKTKSGGAKSKTWTAQEIKPATSTKRKAEGEDEPSGSTKTTKKRVTKSFDAPTAASQAKAAPARTTRTTRSKR